MNGLEVLATPSGSVSAMWAASSQSTSDLWTSLWDPLTSSYSKPVQLTGDAFQEKNLASAWDPAGNPSAVYLKVLLEQQSRTVYDAANNPYPVTANVPTVCDLFMLSHQPKADLAVTSVSASPSNVGPGQAITLSATVQNLRTKGAAAVYLRFCDGDPAVGGKTIKTVYISPKNLTGGASGHASYAWFVPSDGKAHTIYAVADPLGTVAETDETNNKTSMTLLGLDLEAGAPIVNQYLPDGRIGLDLTLRNISSVTMADPVPWELWRGTPGTGTLVASGTQTAPIPGTPLTFPYVWDPTGLASGDYDLTFCLDRLAVLADTDRSNNQATQRIALKADLMVNPYNGMLVMGAGGSATATVTVQNVGWASTPVITVAAFDRSPFAPGAVQLATKNIAGLARFTSANTSLSIPSVGTTGQVWIVTNPSGTIPEVRRDNNEIAFNVPVLLRFTGPAGRNVYGGSSLEYTIELSQVAPAGGTPIALSSSNAVVPVPASVKVPVGLQSYTFTVATTPPAGSVSVSVTASLAGVSKVATIVVHPHPTLVSLTLNPTSVQGGTPSTGVISMNSNGLNGMPPLVAMSDDSPAVSTPTDVVGRYGTTTFPVTTFAVATTQTATVTATYFETTKTATLTITP